MKNRILFAATALVAVVIWGCAKPAPTPDTGADSSAGSNTTQAHDHDGHDHDHGDHADHDHGHATETTPVSLMYCGSCGHSFNKGSEHKCDADHANCEACGLHKGSELCCKIEGEFAGKALCGKCGEIAGSEACCKAGADVCVHCSLHKGSPLCCKLGAESADESAKSAPPGEETGEEGAASEEG